MIIRNEYPRPEYKRKIWQPLNGEWEFQFDDENIGMIKGFYKKNYELARKIVVPFSYQCEASGINDHTHHEVMWYRKEFIIKKELHKKEIILNFNAIDFIAMIWVNGIFVRTHKNGYSRFSVNITPFVKMNTTNVITVRVEDSNDVNQPRGKQSWIEEPFRCWYHATSGIWQSVWLDGVGKDYLKQTLITPDIDNNLVKFNFETQGRANNISVHIAYMGKEVKKVTTTLDGKLTNLTVDLLPHDAIDEIHYWTPEHPNLYDVMLVLKVDDLVVDEVETYFGFRKVSLDGLGHICLNNRPIYQKLVLDQGYWAKTGLTAPSHDAFIKDIQLSKQMGFNGARKHQKIEDPYFYYYADKLGFLVWAEMPSGYQFDHIEVGNIASQYYDLITQFYNFPSIITWVPLNESWGVRKMLTSSKQQAFGHSLYYLTKAIDETRLVNINDGWENPKLTDFVSIHDYSKYGEHFVYEADKLTITKSYPMNRKTLIDDEVDANKPVLITEFGGVSIVEFQKNGTDWGYAGSENINGFYERFATLFANINKADIQGYCYTQLTDVMQETNGLLDADHNPKFDLERIKEIVNG